MGAIKKVPGHGGDNVTGPRSNWRIVKDMFEVESCLRNGLQMLPFWKCRLLAQSCNDAKSQWQGKSIMNPSVEVCIIGSFGLPAMVCRMDMTYDSWFGVTCSNFNLRQIHIVLDSVGVMSSAITAELSSGKESFAIEILEEVSSGMIIASSVSVSEVSSAVS